MIRPGLDRSAHRHAPSIPGEARGWWDPFLLCLTALIAGSAAVLLALQSHLTFSLDEWEFLLDRRGWSVADFLAPHNGHIELAPVSIYKLLIASFGTDSALPFQVTSTLVFLLAAVLLYLYLRRRVGDWPALLGTALILFLGAAWIDLLWPFQIGFSGSIAAGLGALLALERDDLVGNRLAFALLLVSMAFSELGVAFVAGAFVSVLFCRRPRIERLYALVFVPLALYSIWWLEWGRIPLVPSWPGRGTAKSTFSLHNVLDSPRFVFDAASQAAASLLGLATPLTGTGANLVGLDWGRLLLVAGIGAAIWRFRRLGRIPPTFWVAVAIAASFWFSAAFYASQPLGRTPTAGRFQYPGALFLLLIAAEVLRGVRLNRRGLVIGSAVTSAAVLSGLWSLHLGYSKNLKPKSDLLRAQLAAIEIARERVKPGLAVGSPLVPIDAGSYLSAADAYGSPAYTESELASSPDWVRAAADQVLARGLGLRLESRQASLSRDQGEGVTRCRLVAATPNGLTGLAFGPGELRLRARPGASADVWLARFADGFSVRLGRLVPRHPSYVTFPADRSARPWRLGVGGAGDVTVCELRTSPTPAGTQ